MNIIHQDVPLGEKDLSAVINMNKAMQIYTYTVMLQTIKINQIEVMEYRIATEKVNNFSNWIDNLKAKHKRSVKQTKKKKNFRINIEDEINKLLSRIQFIPIITIPIIAIISEFSCAL